MTCPCGNDARPYGLCFDCERRRLTVECARKGIPLEIDDPAVTARIGHLLAEVEP